MKVPARGVCGKQRLDESDGSVGGDGDLVNITSEFGQATFQLFERSQN